jgi:hypothetical protein
MKKLGSLMVAATASATMLMVSAPPASAACNDYLLCVFQYHDYDGGELFTSNTNTNWDYLGNPYAFRFMNDKMSSAKNRTSRTYSHVYQHDSFEGYDYCIPPATNRPNVNNDIENKSSSHTYASGC